MRLQALHKTKMWLLLAALIPWLPAVAQRQELPVMPSQDEQENPDIHGTLVVWQEYVSQYGDYDIYVADINEPEAPIVNALGDASDQTEPAVYGRTVVWQEYIVGGDVADWDIRMADVTDVDNPRVYTVSDLVGIDEQQPAVSGHTIVWEETNGSGYDVYGADVTDPCAPLAFAVAAFELDQRQPAIHRNTVLWQDNYFGDWDLLATDIWLRDAPQDTPIALLEQNQQNGAINGNIAVWEDDFFGDWDIYAARVTKSGTVNEFAVAALEADQRNPDVDGHLVVWQDNRDGNWDIFGYNLVTRRPFRITDDPHDQIRPAISGNTVVWQDRRDGRWNIYAVVLDGPEVARCQTLLPGDVDGNCRVDFADVALMASSWLDCGLDSPELCGNRPASLSVGLKDSLRRTISTERLR